MLQMTVPPVRGLCDHKTVIHRMVRKALFSVRGNHCFGHQGASAFAKDPAPPMPLPASLPISCKKTKVSPPSEYTLYLPSLSRSIMEELKRISCSLVLIS